MVQQRIENCSHIVQADNLKILAFVSKINYRGVARERQDVQTNLTGNWTSPFKFDELSPVLAKVSIKTCVSMATPKGEVNACHNFLHTR